VKLGVVRNLPGVIARAPVALTSYLQLGEIRGGGPLNAKKREISPSPSRKATAANVA
jgi:hypothetical protein